MSSRVVNNHRSAQQINYPNRHLRSNQHESLSSFTGFGFVGQRFWPSCSRWVTCALARSVSNKWFLVCILDLIDWEGRNLFSKVSCRHMSASFRCWSASNITIFFLTTEFYLASNDFEETLENLLFSKFILHHFWSKQYSAIFSC